MSKVRSLTLFILLLILTSCSSGDATPEPSATLSPPTVQPTLKPSETPTTVPATPTPPTLVGPLRGNLALRLGIAPENIEVTVIEKTIWPDASLGCPDPEQMYA
jgi:hypothetical protein